MEINMRQTAVNEFKDGMNLDLHPIVTPNSVLTDNLNGTFITYNGNEFCLQNDRGNTWTCNLSNGFIPIGAKEHGGIIYIVSVNSETHETEIGNYPGVNWDLDKGKLNYESYTPFRNLYVDSEYTTKVVDGFRFVSEYDVNTPVTIEVQDSYDGSVNLIIIGGESNPIIINSGFSVTPDATYTLIDRQQDVDTNKYHLESLSEQINLIRNSFVISNVELINVSSGGQLKGGNYKFYIKFGDDDFNQTDVVAESGIVSIFNGNNGVPSTISGTLSDERTDKMIHLNVSGLNHVYSKIYVYYTREYSDTQGYRMTEVGMFSEPIDMIEKQLEEIGRDPSTNKPIYREVAATNQEIVLTGFEQTVPINIEELNVDYHTIDFAKAETQHSNMLFLGNIGQKETFDLYRELKNFTKAVTVTAGTTPIDSDLDLYKWKLYYDVNNIYYNVGYYPGEIYRFGIVYILKDGSTTPVFNMLGGKLSDTDGILIDNSEYNNEYGVFIMPDFNTDNTEFCVIKPESVDPIYLNFTLSNATLPESVIGWFVVRQKRIPNVICQGLSAKIDSKSHTPVIYDGDHWISQSFLSAGRHPFISNKPPVLEYNDISFSDNSENIMSYQEFEESHNIEQHEYYFCPNRALYGATYDDYETFQRALGAYDGSWWTMIYDESINTAQSIFENGGSVTLYQQEYVLRGSDDRGIYVRPLFSFNEHPLRVKYHTLVEGVPEYFDYPGYNKHNVEIPAGRYPILEFAHNSHIQEDTVDAYNKYLSEHSIENKIIWETDDNGRILNSEQLKSRMSSDCILSVDPCVNSTVKSTLDGSEFVIKKVYSTSINVKSNKCLYEYIPFIANDANESIINSKAVFVNSDTVIKVVDNSSFSTIAGDPTDASKFSYFATSFLVSTNIDNEGSATQFDHNQYNSDVSNLHSSKNINLLRGKFCPFVGLTYDEMPIDSSDIYAIKLKDKLNINDITVRKQDNSEYYCISKRFDLTKDVPETSMNVYGGDCYVCTVTIRIIRNFIDPEVPSSENILDKYCWIKGVTSKAYSFETNEVNELVNFKDVNLADVNTSDLGMWVTFRCLSNYNLGLRSKDTFHTDEMSMLGSPRTFYPINGLSTATGAKVEESWLLNDGYNASVGRKRYNLLPDVPYTKSEFSNRIMFSNVNVTDAFTNGYRTFQGLSYKDYDKQYGPITKLVSWGSNILCVMEHGIGLIPVNEKALIQTIAGEDIHIYGHGVLPDQMTIISQDYGSKYPHSVIRTPIGVYGIDTDARKIWRVTTKQGFETISDMKIETYLNDNLFTDVESVLQTVDVRTHYNAFKGDIMFTFYNTEKDYLVVPNTVTIFENESVIIDIKTNLDDLEYTINNPEIASVSNANDMIRVIGNTVGTTELIVSNEFVNKTIHINVLSQSYEPGIPKKHYLSTIPKNITIYVGQIKSIALNEDIDLSNLEVNFDNSIISVTNNEFDLNIEGLNKGTCVMTVQYEDEVAVCNVNVLETLDEDVEPEDQSTDTYYTVWVHAELIPDDDSYPDDFQVTLTYNGTTESINFNFNKVEKLLVKKGTVLNIACYPEGLVGGSWNYTITSNNMNAYFHLKNYKTFTIDSVNAPDATITINGEEAVVGQTYEYPYNTGLTVEATAPNHLKYSETFYMTEDINTDLVLDEGEFYLKFNINHNHVQPNGSYQTGGVPLDATVSYEINRNGSVIVGTRDRSQGLRIPLCAGDSVSYTLEAPGFDSISAVREDVQEEQTIKYWMEESGYHTFRIRNIPKRNYIKIQADGTEWEDIMWSSNVLHFREGRVLTIKPIGYDSFEYIMPDENVLLDVSAHINS